MGTKQKRVKKQVAIKIDSWVHEKISILAKMDNRSFSNYVETLLLQELKTPNDITLKAIKEAENGNTEEIDNVDDFLNSI